MTSNTPVLAVDVGGTKMAAAIVDTDGELLASDRIATLRTQDPDALFEPLRALCARLLATAPRVAAIGVGCGGPMRYPQGIVSPLSPRPARMESAQ